MHVDIAKKIYEDKLNANFPKIRFTYIKLKRNFCKQCAPNFILREFAAIQNNLNRERGEQENKGIEEQGNRVKPEQGKLIKN